MKARWLGFVVAAGCGLLDSGEAKTESTPSTEVGKSEAPAKVADAAAPAAKKDDPVASVAEVITAASLKRVVEALASDVLGGRRTPSPGLDTAAQIIVDEYRRIGLTAHADATAYVQRFDCNGRGLGNSSNVIGVLVGSDPVLAKQHVIVSAHYDHLGSTADSEGVNPGDPSDKVFNGANDDASGVAAMLGVAEALAKMPTRPKRSVAFIGFCGEELGLRGSEHWVAHPLIPLADTIAVVNLEMLGRPETDRPTRMWMTGKARSTMGDVLVAAAKDGGIEVVDGGEVGEFMGKLFDKSDNWSFAAKGVVAHSVSTGVIDEYYHSVDDEVDALRFDAMAPQVRGVVRGVWVLANADAVPSWIGGPPAK